MYRSAQKTKKFKSYTKPRHVLDIHDIAELLDTSPQYASRLLSKYNTTTMSNVQMQRLLIELIQERGQV